MAGDVKGSAMEHPAMARALAGIRTEFVEGLVLLFNEVEYQSFALGNPATVTSALESLQRVAHKVSGMAGSVGFAALGNHAAHLDMTLVRMRRGNTNPASLATLGPRLETFMDLMEQALDEDL
jgi:chemotaxis protein histidine kinase CheA